LATNFELHPENGDLIDGTSKTHKTVDAEEILRRVKGDIASVLAGQFAALSHDEYDVLCTMATLGMTCDISQLTRIHTKLSKIFHQNKNETTTKNSSNNDVVISSDDDDVAIFQSSHHLEALQFVYRMDGETVSFAHEIIREVLLERLSSSRRGLHHFYTAVDFEDTFKAAYRKIMTWKEADRILFEMASSSASAMTAKSMVDMGMDVIDDEGTLTKSENAGEHAKGDKALGVICHHYEEGTMALLSTQRTSSLQQQQQREEDIISSISVYPSANMSANSATTRTRTPPLSRLT